MHFNEQEISQLYGVEQALHITDTQYLIALTVFFIPYAAFEVGSPSKVEEAECSLF